MPRGIIEIRECIRAQSFDLSKHADEEMGEDGLDLFDVEHAILDGHVEREEHEDPRGTKYVVVGAAVDGSLMVTVGRFKETGQYLIITVYRLD